MRQTAPLKPLQWHFETIAYGLIENTVRWLPGRLVFRLGEVLGDLAWQVFSQRRKVVSRNLRIALGDQMSANEIKAMVRASFRRTGANMLSATHTARLSPARLIKNIRVENLHLMEEAHAEGKGVVLLLAHMGNWEALSRLVYFFPKGLKIGGFYRPLNNPLLDEKILKRRQADGSRMFSKKDPFHQATGFLREGGMVGVLADQRVGMQGDVISFFGRTTRGSPLPSLLARRAKSRVIALSLATESPGKWVIHLHQVAMPYSTKNCMTTMETAMRVSPLDVFWMQERWKLFARKKRTLEHYLGDGNPAGGKPYRALIWLAGAPPAWQVPETWQHPDVIYEIVLSAGETKPAWLPQSTTFHQTQSAKDPAGLRRMIASIDETTPFPIDFILAPKGLRYISEAAKKESIPLISLP